MGGGQLVCVSPCLFVNKHIDLGTQTDCEISNILQSFLNLFVTYKDSEIELSVIKVIVGLLQRFWNIPINQKMIRTVIHIKLLQDK